MKSVTLNRNGSHFPFKVKVVSLETCWYCFCFVFCVRFTLWKQVTHRNYCQPVRDYTFFFQPTSGHITSNMVNMMHDITPSSSLMQKNAYFCCLKYICWSDYFHCIVKMASTQCHAALQHMHSLQCQCNNVQVLSGFNCGLTTPG